MEALNIIVRILTIAGSIGLFLFGMKHMSNSLQIVAGNRMRNILSTMTSNPFRGIMSGLAVTGTVQSSSAVTVMVVSFVNAGLLSLAEATSLIMGANIGTTVTAWLISFFGFSMNIYIIFLPLIGFTFPLLFSRKSRNRSWGEFFVGLAILFIGLQLLKDNVPNIQSNAEILDFLHVYTDKGYLSILIFVLIGTILTIIVQSSSATIALTLVLCYNGLISFELAAAMVLGENLGTTVTANLAAIVANSSARKSARIHFLFNLIGIILILPFFTLIMKGYNNITSTLFNFSVFDYQGIDNPEIRNSIPLILASFHSLFNIIATLVLVGFTPALIKLSGFLVRKSDEKEQYHLRFFSGGLSSISELSTIQAKKQIVEYAQKVITMFNLIPELLLEKDDKKYSRLLKKIDKYEDSIDLNEVEIAKYLSRLSEDEVSLATSKKIRSMLKIIDEIESIGDTCHVMARNIKIKNNKKVWFNQEMRDNLFNMFNLVKEAMAEMAENLDADYKKANTERSYKIEDEINSLRDKLKAKHLKDINKNIYPYESGTYYSDMISSCEKIGDYIMNITTAIAEMNSQNPT